VTHRLAADGTVLDRTEVPVFIDPASLAHTPPGFLDQWLTTVSLTTTSDGVVASVHLDAVGREGGAIFDGTTALVEFDAGGRLEAPWSTEGIMPPALRSAEGIFQEWIDVTALPGSDRLVSTTRSGPAGDTVSISLPGAWTITPTSPFDTSALRRTGPAAMQRQRSPAGGRGGREPGRWQPTDGRRVPPLDRSAGHLVRHRRLQRRAPHP
jgi:hypothetical protein